MPEYLQITRESPAHAGASSASPVVTSLAPGHIVKLIRDEGKLFFRVAAGGRALYVSKDCTTPATEDDFLTFRASGPEVGFEDLRSPAGKEEGSLAPFAERAGASIIDAILSNVVFLPIVVFAAIFAPSVQPVVTIIAAIVLVLYFLYLNANGGTWGKRFVGIKIVVEETGEPPGVRRALIRQLAAVVSSLPLYLGYFWMVWEGRKRTWHDMAAGTIVVRSNWFPRTKE